MADDGEGRCSWGALAPASRPWSHLKKGGQSAAHGDAWADHIRTYLSPPSPLLNSVWTLLHSILLYSAVLLSSPEFSSLESLLLVFMVHYGGLQLTWTPGRDTRPGVLRQLMLFIFVFRIYVLYCCVMLRWRLEEVSWGWPTGRVHLSFREGWPTLIVVCTLCVCVPRLLDRPQDVNTLLIALIFDEALQTHHARVK